MRRMRPLKRAAHQQAIHKSLQRRRATVPAQGCGCVVPCGWINSVRPAVPHVPHCCVQASAQHMSTSETDQMAIRRREEEEGARKSDIRLSKLHRRPI